MVAIPDERDPVGELAYLASALESMEIGPAMPEAARERDRLVSALRSYLIPRFEDPPGPLVVVFAGPTGSGKSTLINSLTGRELSKAGSLRPTTAEPVALAAPAVAGRAGRLAGLDGRVVTGSAPILTEMILVDTPDIDSTSLEHRVSAESLIDGADVVVFVTSALRYADDVAWQVLRRAVSRGAEVIHVLNRATAGAAGAQSDLRSRLRQENLDERLVVVPEHHVPPGGQRIPSLAVGSLRRRLARIAGQRAMEAGSTRDRVLGVTLHRVATLIDEVADEREDAEALAAELSLELSQRAARLDVTGLRSLGGIPRPPKGRFARSRWRRALRVDADGIGALERALVEELSAAIHGDLRSWVEDRRHDLDVTSIDGRLVSAAAPSIASTLDGWVSFVRHIAFGHDRRNTSAVELVLLESVLDGRETIAREVLGADSSVLADRARRELTARIGIVYEHIGSLVAELIRADLGDLDDGEVRIALGLAVSATSFVDA